jgi:hypothetical protein
MRKKMRRKERNINKEVKSQHHCCNDESASEVRVKKLG